MYKLCASAENTQLANSQPAYCYHLHSQCICSPDLYKLGGFATTSNGVQDTDTECDSLL